MDNKYYTPEIEEFHVGFEYRLKGEKVTRTLTTNCTVDAELSEVKYLDREDIVSLGFVKRNPENNNKSSDYFKMKAPGKIAYWTEIDLDFRWGFKEVSIRGVRGNEDDYLFRGTIKNKSELKKLLKQLRIQ